jgi:hypothetical protein
VRCPSISDAWIVRSPAPSHWTANPAATARHTGSSDSWMDCDPLLCAVSTNVVPPLAPNTAPRTDPPHTVSRTTLGGARPRRPRPELTLTNLNRLERRAQNRHKANSQGQTGQCASNPQESWRAPLSTLPGVTWFWLGAA